ncbi:MAG: mandelate racemase/muconate lactonizing enzyme family protein [Bryobacter sp.]|nr:mandelate racemase/muconate lactonizing enzyme family protein [Bryobacter sp.]
MRVARVEPHLLTYVFPQPIELDYWGGHRTIHKRDAMVIKVVADNGLIGYAPGMGSEAARDAIVETIAPWLTGKAILDPDALRIQFLDGPGKDRNLAKVYFTVEVALYDLAAQAQGVPVSELLGGRIRDRILLYGSGGMYMPPSGYAEEAAAVKALGFRAYKMRPGMGPDADARAVEAMRAAVGPGMDLMVDAHTWWRMGDKSYTPTAVEDLARALAQHDICWLEEPLPPADHAAYRALREKEIVPLAAGEHEHSEAGFLDLLDGPAVDYLQADVVCQGGYAWGRKLFAAVGQAGLRFAFHSWGTWLEVLAAAHIGICWPEHVVEWLEYPVYAHHGRKVLYEWPLAEELLVEPLEVRDGELVVPRGPGLGIHVNEAVFEKYPWVPGPWSTFSLHSPAKTYAVYNDHSVEWV